MVRDRYRGALLGLAIGDALGITLEFKAPGTFNQSRTWSAVGRLGWNQVNGPTIPPWLNIWPRA
jgi:hypothetical protein